MKKNDFPWKNTGKLSKADEKRLLDKRLREEKEILEKLNIPERDEEKYPLPDQSEAVQAFSFVYTLNLVASNYDGNLNSLLLNFYKDFRSCLDKSSGQEELASLISSLSNLKKYLAESNNPLFSRETPPQKEIPPEEKKTFPQK